MKSKIIKLKPRTFLERVDSNKMLLREFIHDRLYGEGNVDKNVLGGYFTQDKHQVGRLREPIKFTKL